MPILGLKLQKEFGKKNINTVFTSGANLKSILCQNKSKLLPNSYRAIYTLNCSCNAEYIVDAKYTGRKYVMTKTTEYQQQSIKRKWKSSGAMEHCLKCHSQFNRLHPKTLSREARYKSRKIRESREIKRSKCDSSKSNINCSDDNLVKTNYKDFCWETLTILKVPCETKESIAEQMWRQINFCKSVSCIWSICLKTTPTSGVRK